MSRTGLGSYVLYKEPGPDQVPVPGFVYDDSHAPLNIQRSRPTAYMTLVLLLTEPYRFCWATAIQLSTFVPVDDANLLTHSRDLLQAYKIVAFMMEAGVGLEHWQEEVETQFGNDTLPDPETEDIWEDEEELDEELRQAMRVSLRDHHEATSHSLSTPSYSPIERHRRRSSTVTLEEDGHATVHVRPRAQNDFHSTPKRSRPSRVSSPTCVDDNQPVRKRRKWSSPSPEHNDCQSVEQENRPRAKRSAGQVSTSLRLDDQNSDLDTDVVEGELSESKEFVQVLVGRHGEMRTFLKKDLWNRPYFRDARTGIMYFFLTEEGIWQLRHPQLININIDDFQFVAEFLTDEAFGIRYPEDQEQNKEAVAQCVSAWEAAEKLGLDDMLAHIAKKVHFLQWDNADVLTWAITLYRTSGLVLEVHQELKDWVAGFLAHHYWAYIKDDTIGDIFRKRLRVLPELEKDVTVKRAELLTTGAKFDEEEESDEDAMVDGDDL